MEGNPVKITDTTLRDAHQSLMATRMKVEHMLEIAPYMDGVGYHSLEMWGGATFDSCMRFLDEDPWERLKKLREAMPNTKLQMLLRGQNIVGYRHYADDVVNAFVHCAAKNGIDIFRIFDALNDVRNMKQAISAVKKEKKHVQATICYTISPMHSNNHFINLGKELEESGADSICIKDMAGLISPYDAEALVKGLKATLSIPVQLHCHYTSGMASMAYLKAVEAGVDVIDTATASLSLGSSQPPTDSLVAALKNTPRDTGLDLEKLSYVSDHFKRIRQEYNIPLQVALGVDTNVLNYQIPGGMISNLTSQLAQQQSEHLLPKVLEEVPRVREELGFPPLVTPSSQIVGTQAVINVLLGERYKMVITEVKNYLRGFYGKPPGEVNPDLRKQVLGDEEPITCRPADLIEPQLEAAREEIKQYLQKEEDAISYAIFPQVALPFFQRRKGESPPLTAAESSSAGNKKKEAKKEIDFSGIAEVDTGLIVVDDYGKAVAYPS